jgi:hypothetical protein
MKARNILIAVALTVSAGVVNAQSHDVTRDAICAAWFDYKQRMVSDNPKAQQEMKSITQLFVSRMRTQLNQAQLESKLDEGFKTIRITMQTVVKTNNPKHFDDIGVGCINYAGNSRLIK